MNELQVCIDCVKCFLSLHVVVLLPLLWGSSLADNVDEGADLLECIVNISHYCHSMMESAVPHPTLVVLSRIVSTLIKQQYPLPTAPLFNPILGRTAVECYGQSHLCLCLSQSPRWCSLLRLQLIGSEAVTWSTTAAQTGGPAFRWLAGI